MGQNQKMRDIKNKKESEDPKGANPEEKVDSTVFDTLEHKLRVLKFQIILSKCDYFLGVWKVSDGQRDWNLCQGEQCWQLRSNCV